MSRSSFANFTVELGKHKLGPGEAPYIIAEIGANHNGDMELCRKTIDAAAASGAHAVKFQSWSKRSLICKQEYERNTSYTDTKRHFGSLEAMVEQYQLSPEQHREIQAYCETRGITFLSSAFSFEEVDLLVALKVPAIKIASMDINHWPLLRYLAKQRVPVLLSTGMATLSEIEEAVRIFDGQCPVVLMHCVSLYPPDENQIHLSNIPMLRQALPVASVGFSDHTLGTTIPLAAVALGATVIEKHFTLDKSLPGWDHWLSADPEELATLVEGSRSIAKALGTSYRQVSQAEHEKRKAFRRCIVAKKDLPSGKVLTWDDFDYKRPGRGIDPNLAERLLGASLINAVEADTPLSWSDIGIEPMAENKPAAMAVASA